MPRVPRIRSQPTSSASPASPTSSTSTITSSNKETSVNVPGFCRYPGCVSTCGRAYDVGRHLVKCHAIRELRDLGPNPYLPPHAELLVFASDQKLLDLGVPTSRCLRRVKKQLEALNEKLGYLRVAWMQSIGFGGNTIVAQPTSPSPAPFESVLATQATYVPEGMSTFGLGIPGNDIPDFATVTPPPTELVAAQYLPTPSYTSEAHFSIDMSYLYSDPPQVADTHSERSPAAFSTFGESSLGVYLPADGPLNMYEPVHVEATPESFRPLSSSARPFGFNDNDLRQLGWSFEMDLNYSGDIIPSTTNVPMVYGFPEPCPNE
ncbi:hypothetical protein BKA62DRAFT_760640 [Auriculariales sp. MPI-PUGE-AT-0066]|nr:hypothetical protein BKA62DRAFT_760640 [Auriculariales sp. MPI-PUGE-AT-0066]